MELARRYQRFQQQLLLVLLASALVSPSGAAPAQDARETVRLTIDYGDGVQKSFIALPWKASMTAFDSLVAAEKHPRGIKLSYMGNRDSVFVTAIDDAENEGAGKRNWRYKVNDQSLPYSAGVADLKPGDTVLWRFGR